MDTHKQYSYELSVKSSTSQLSAIRSFILQHAELHGIAQKAIDEIMLAADEAATNIVKHAYHMKDDRNIQITLTISADECTITLTDEGDAFDPSVIPEPDMKEYIKSRKVGGLGLYLIRTLMDGMEYKTVPGAYNRLIIRKSL